MCGGKASDLHKNSPGGHGAQIYHGGMCLTTDKLTCLAASKLALMGKKADKKLVLKRWINVFLHDNVLPYTIGLSVKLPSREGIRTFIHTQA